MAKAAKPAATKNSSAKRTTIAPNGDKRYIKRDEKGQIKESDDQHESLSHDVKKHAKTVVKPGYGDQGDQVQKKTGPKKAGALKKAPAKNTAAPQKATAPRKAAAKKSTGK